MRRSELLEMLLLQSKEIDRLRLIIEEKTEKESKEDSQPSVQVNI